METAIFKWIPKICLKKLYNFLQPIENEIEDFVDHLIHEID